ncbi:MAG: hypothetical protein JWP97_34 [Labilithrix sp.]|nr:hypothetical protein [Labilithrix sp.]
MTARARGLLALASFVVGFVVRAFWAMRVQSPLGAIYSDMGGYVGRAEGLLAGTTPGDPRVLLMWPWGTHVLVAGEIALFGRNAPVAFALVHAAVGALAAACAALLTARFTGSRAWVLVSGLVVALWHPHVVYAGFFSSEIWFSAAILIFSVLLVRRFERGGHAGHGWAAGLALAVAFAVRPQILMTCGMIGALVALGWLRRPFTRPRGGAVGVMRLALPFLVPVLVTMAGSAVRYHRLSGELGLIASNEPAQRLFGETSVGKIESHWVAPDGAAWSWWVSPHTKQPLRPEHVVRYEGFVYDKHLLEQIRRDRLRGVTWRARAARMVDNVALLAVRNLPWPEDDFRRIPVRLRLQRFFARALQPLLVLAAGGLLFLGRHGVARIVLLTQLVTIVSVAALYLGEARYRVPYDPFLVVVAVVGASAAVRGLRSLAGRARRTLRPTP